MEVCGLNKINKNLCIVLSLAMVFASNASYGKDDSVPKTFNPIFTPKDSVELKKFKDNMWVTLSDLKFEFGEEPHRISIIVPAGFVNDTTSMMGLKNKKFLNNSSILHDYLYWVQPCKGEIGFKVANKIMKQTIKINLSRGLAFIAKASVQALGRKAWKNNAELKKSGHTRFATKFIKNEYWKEIEKSSWESFLKTNNLKQVDQDNIINDPSVCDVFLAWRDK